MFWTLKHWCFAPFHPFLYIHWMKPHWRFISENNIFPIHVPVCDTPVQAPVFLCVSQWLYRFGFAFHPVRSVQLFQNGPWTCSRASPFDQLPLKFWHWSAFFATHQSSKSPSVCTVKNLGIRAPLLCLIPSPERIFSTTRHTVERGIPVDSEIIFGFVIPSCTFSKMTILFWSAIFSWRRRENVVCSN